MSESESIALELKHLGGYEFRLRFLKPPAGKCSAMSLRRSGGARGPTRPAPCRSGGQLPRVEPALRPAQVQERARAALGRGQGREVRNSEGRWRIGRIQVQLRLNERGEAIARAAHPRAVRAILHRHRERALGDPVEVEVRDAEGMLLRIARRQEADMNERSRSSPARIARPSIACRARASATSPPAATVTGRCLPASRRTGRRRLSPPCARIRAPGARGFPGALVRPLRMMAPAFAAAAPCSNRGCAWPRSTPRPSPGSPSAGVSAPYPTLILFAQGRELARTSGAQSTARIVEFAERGLAQAF